MCPSSDNLNRQSLKLYASSFLITGEFLSKEKYSVLTPGDHGSSYGGNPLACAAAYAVVNHVVENNIITNVIKSGHRLKEGLKQFIDKYE